MTFDELRAANPDLAVSLYALEPGGFVTLEILTPDGQAFTFRAETAAAAIERAFPADALGQAETAAPNVFD